MEKAEDKKKHKKPKIHGTFVKVNDENIDEVAKALVEKAKKIFGPKGH